LADPNGKIFANATKQNILKQNAEEKFKIPYCNKSMTNKSKEKILLAFKNGKHYKRRISK